MSVSRAQDAVGGALASRVRGIAGDAHVTVDPDRLDAWRVDGVRPGLWAVPADAEQVAALLTAAADTGAGVIPRGAGAHQHLGMPPARADLIVETTRLDGITDYTPADYVVAVRAGTRFRALQEALAANGQWLPLDPPGAADATIGGLVAANRNGPRRLLWGSIRDLVIGIRVALPTGEVIKAGGKVVKNVAGYDLAKLFIGSFGSCGIITDVTFKILPLPGDGVTVLVTAPDAAAAHALTTAVMRSYLLPSALEAANPGALAMLARAAGVSLPSGGGASGTGRWGVLLLAEGLGESRTRHIDEMRALTAAAGPGAALEVISGAPHDALWQAVAEFPSPASHPGGVVFRVGTPITRWLDVAAAAQAASDTPPAAVLAHAGVGLTYVAAAPGVAVSLADALGRCACGVSQGGAAGQAAPAGADTASGGAADALGGYVVVEAAPTALKPSLPVWGQAPPAVDLMRRLRAQYDPKGIMVPGRLGWLS
ncbi:MAG TPA: FAD-binding oxidoreductase [bacterium]|nr:FAD-binding oxidoreductase [bacterium]